MQKKAILQYYNNDDRILEAAGFYNHWPHGRAVYISGDKQIEIVVNDYDHVKIIVEEQFDGIGKAYDRLVRIHEHLETAAGNTFCKSDKLGYLSTDPSKCGTSMSVSMFVKLPMLAKELCEIR